MAERAAARKLIAAAQEEIELTRRNEHDEAAIARAAEDAIEDAAPFACACVGPPPGCTLCYCHIRAEARARAEGRPCGWCER